MPQFGNRNLNAAVYLILDDNGRIPLLFRSSTGFMDNHWSLIAGRLKNDESLVQAIIREAREEAGITVNRYELKVVQIASRYQKYDNAPAVNWIEVYFYSKYRGQKIYNAEPDKHSKLEWFPLKKLPKHMAPYEARAINSYLKNKTFSQYGFK